VADAAHLPPALVLVDPGIAAHEVREGPEDEEDEKKESNHALMIAYRYHKHQSGYS
jgi:hypothetical protein